MQNIDLDFIYDIAAGGIPNFYLMKWEYYNRVSIPGIWLSRWNT